MTTKAKFMCVSPKTNKAKNRFANLMDSLHSCKVEQEDDNNEPLEKFLKSDEGKRQIDSFLKGLFGNIDTDVVVS